MEDQSDFNKIYIEVILTRGILSENDLILMLKVFGIGSFEEYAGDPSSLRDMCYVLINEVGQEKLLAEIRRVMEEEYIDRLSYQEAANWYENLKNRSLDELKNFYEKNFQKEKLKPSVNEDDLIVLILGELLKLGKEEANLLFKF